MGCEKRICCDTSTPVKISQDLKNPASPRLLLLVFSQGRAGPHHLSPMTGSAIRLVRLGDAGLTMTTRNHAVVVVALVHTPLAELLVFWATVLCMMQLKRQAR